MGRASKKTKKYDKQTHFKNCKNEYKPINNKGLHKYTSAGPKKNKPISNPKKFPKKPPKKKLSTFFSCKKIDYS
jgi:hypothetical protein